MWAWMVPESRATVSAPPDFRSQTCAGPRMVIPPPSTRLMRAWPELTWTSLPLRRTVFIWPWTTSTLMGPSTEMESPSMEPMESPGGLSARISGALEESAQKNSATSKRGRSLKMEFRETAKRNCSSLTCDGVAARWRATSGNLPILYEDGNPGHAEAEQAWGAGTAGRAGRGAGGG